MQLNRVCRRNENFKSTLENISAKLADVKRTLNASSIDIAERPHSNVKKRTRSETEDGPYSKRVAIGDNLNSDSRKGGILLPEEFRNYFTHTTPQKQGRSPVRSSEVPLRDISNSSDFLLGFLNESQSTIVCHSSIDTDVSPRRTQTVNRSLAKASDNYDKPASIFSAYRRHAVAPNPIIIPNQGPFPFLAARSLTRTPPKPHHDETTSWEKAAALDAPGLHKEEGGREAREQESIALFAEQCTSYVAVECANGSAEEVSRQTAPSPLDNMKADVQTRNIAMESTNIDVTGSCTETSANIFYSLLSGGCNSDSSNLKGVPVLSDCAERFAACTSGSFSSSMTSNSSDIIRRISNADDKEVATAQTLPASPVIGSELYQWTGRDELRALDREIVHVRRELEEVTRRKEKAREISRRRAPLRGDVVIHNPVAVERQELGEAETQCSSTSIDGRVDQCRTSIPHPTIIPSFQNTALNRENHFLSSLADSSLCVPQKTPRRPPLETLVFQSLAGGEAVEITERIHRACGTLTAPLAIHASAAAGLISVPIYSDVVGFARSSFPLSQRSAFHKPRRGVNS